MIDGHVCIIANKITNCFILLLNDYFLLLVLFSVSPIHRFSVSLLSAVRGLRSDHAFMHFSAVLWL
jgi:hypothetical protein